MDSLFSIQRYLGSDDEEEENSKYDISGDNCNISNKKLKLDIPIISYQDDKNCNKKQNLVLPKESVYNEKCSELESSPEIDILDDFDCPNEVNHNSSKEIEIIGTIKASGHLKKSKNRISTKEISPVIKNSALKKGKKRKKRNKREKKLNNTIGQESDEIQISNTVKANGCLKKSENKTSAKEIDCVSRNHISKKIKKHKLSDVMVQEIEKTIPLENNASKVIENVDETFCTIGQKHYKKDEKVIHALPHWLRNPTNISVNLLENEKTSISELNYLDSDVKRNLNDVGISFLFPVQVAVIPWLMQSKEQSLLIRPSDICVSAPTGSGKTLAFVLPIIQSLKDRVLCAIRALIILPVNELAFQVYEVFETFIRGTDLKIALLTGKKSFISEQNELVKLKRDKFQNLVDIVIATPGRLLDHIYRTEGFCLKYLQYLVIDEADRMMGEIQGGLLKQVEDAVFRDCAISNCVCSSFKRTSFEKSSAFNFGCISQPLQKLLYSATLTHDPELLHSLSLYKPKLFAASDVNAHEEYIGTYTLPSGLNMLQAVCKEATKPMIICHLIKHFNFKKVLCFTKTAERAHRLHLVLEKIGLFKVREISSFNRVVQRKIALGQFISGKVDILVGSDLVARGMDIENVDCVISYDVPQYIKIYIHRIGRTARAGKTGTAITLLSKGEIPHFKEILKNVNIKMPEEIIVTSEHLKPFVDSYKDALALADIKLRKEKVSENS